MSLPTATTAAQATLYKGDHIIREKPGQKKNKQQ